MKAWKRIFILAAATVLFVIAGFHYAGYSSFQNYQAARARAKSIESAFPALKSTLKKAVRCFGHPAFWREEGRLYVEMALAENAFGTAEKRDSYLDRAVVALGRAVRNNPVDASAVFDLGRAFLLYNDPVPIYQDKARRFFLQALELAPADEFLNTNVLFLFLAQWDSLDESEKAFVRARLADAARNNPFFIESIKKMWRKNFGDARRLDGIL